MKNKIDLTKGNILRDLLIVAIPTLLTSLIQMAYNLTDMFWVAQVDGLELYSNLTTELVGEMAVAAVGTAGFYPWFGFGIMMLASIGTSVKVSQAAGMHDQNLLQRIGNNGILLMAIIAILYLSFGVFFNQVFIGFFKIDNLEMFDMATSYLRIVTSFGFALCMVQLFNGVYNGLGKTMMTFYISFSGLFLNIILDPIFILDTVNVFGLFTINGLGMGVEGAAYATGIGQLSILIIYIVIYTNKTWRPFTITVKEYSSKVLNEILRIGLPTAIQSIVFTLIAMNVARMVLEFGEEPMAVQRVGSQIESVAWMIASGFQVALASFVGQNFGAEKYDRIKEGYKTAMKLLVPYGILVNLVLFVFARPLFSIFFSNPVTLDIGETYLRILSISQLFMIVELATAGVFNGLGMTKYPSIVGITGNLLRIPAAMILGASIGYAGIFWGVSMSSVLKGTVLVIWLLYFLRKLGKPDGILFENKL